MMEVRVRVGETETDVLSTCAFKHVNQLRKRSSNRAIFNASDIIDAKWCTSVATM
jgi:hypothetical protein